MNVAMVGLGKLGLPLALAMESRGHEVYGYDVSPKVWEIMETKKLPYVEEGAQELLSQTRIQWAKDFKLLPLASIDLCFIAVQTPHDPRFEGSAPLVDEPEDFDYTYLVQACKDVAAAGGNFPVAIISTVLPGTIERLCTPILGRERVVYNPSFIAMGTAVQDFLDPDLVLVGADDQAAAQKLHDFYCTFATPYIFNARPVTLGDRVGPWVSIASAELTKVAYNTYIGQKIVFANHLAELCDASGADVDEVCCLLGSAHKRLMSPLYLRAGMGDGGGCHPRDNIALKWYAKKIGESYDVAGEQIKAREAQSQHLADLIAKKAGATGLPVVLLGKAYKKGTALTVGSPASLLANQLEAMEVPFKWFDPIVDAPYIEANGLNAVAGPFYTSPHLYVITTNHDEFADGMTKGWPRDSVVIDPWGYVRDKTGLREYVSPGRRSRPALVPHG